MSTPTPTMEQKHSVYIALAGAIIISLVDLTQNHSVEASTTVVMALLAFAGLRQGLKSFLKR